MRLCIRTALISAISLSTSAFAHHSFADYDDKIRQTLTGTLKEVRFTNPHIGLTVDVRGKNGVVETWQFGGPSPVDWRAAGWVKSDFVVGQTVTITGFRKRDGSKSLSINILKLGNKTFGRIYN